jgi:hypothetical protein
MLALVPYVPVGVLRGKRPRYVTLSEASQMLDGLLSPGVIRDMILAGKVPGARKAGHRYFVDRRYVPDLVTDMSGGAAAETLSEVETSDEIGWHSRRAHTVLDGYLDAG